MFTYRDFEMGTLGLAWTGDLKNAGGVCEKNGVSISSNSYIFRHLIIYILTIGISETAFISILFIYEPNIHALIHLLSKTNKQQGCNKIDNRQY